MLEETYNYRVLDPTIIQQWEDKVLELYEKNKALIAEIERLKQ